IRSDRIGGESCFERCNIDEQLERRARLPHRLGGAVELAHRKIGAAQERAHPPIAIKRHERALADMPVLVAGYQRLDCGIPLHLMPHVKSHHKSYPAAYRVGVSDLSKLRTRPGEIVAGGDGNWRQ